MTTCSTTFLNVGDLVYLRVHTLGGNFKEYRPGILLEHIKYSQNNPGNHELAYMVYIQWDNVFKTLAFFPDELIASVDMVWEDDE